jgi:hypothetical protein
MFLKFESFYFFVKFELYLLISHSNSSFNRKFIWLIANLISGWNTFFYFKLPRKDQLWNPFFLLKLFPACNGQLCGVYDTSALSQSIVVFNNSHFPLIASTCEDAFIKTSYPPESSQLIDLTPQSGFGPISQVSYSLKKLKFKTHFPSLFFIQAVIF